MGRIFFFKIVLPESNLKNSQNSNFRPHNLQYLKMWYDGPILSMYSHSKQKNTSEKILNCLTAILTPLFAELCYPSLESILQTFLFI